jgi:hypothetical protein
MQPQDDMCGKENSSNLSNLQRNMENDDQGILVGSGGLRYRKKVVSE